MAKGNRKRSNVKKEEQAVDMSKLRPMTQSHAMLFQNLINISNHYAKLRQQYEEYTTVVASLKERRKKVQTGEIPMPVQMPLGKNKYWQCNDKKKILAELDDEIKIISNALKGVQGQMTNQRDAYVEAGLAVHEFAEHFFIPFKPNNVYARGCIPKGQEKVIFEAELDELIKDSKKQEEFKEAKAKAVKENKKLAKKA